MTKRSLQHTSNLAGTRAARPDRRPAVTRGTILLSSMLAATAGAGGCSPPAPTIAPDGTERIERPLADLGVERVIPIRFVQFSTGAVDFRAQVEGANTVFKAAGVQFYIKAIHAAPDSTFNNIDGTSYTWPTPISSAAPLVFNKSCAIDPPPPQSESKDQALWRAASYCSFDGEILVYIVDSGPIVNGGPHSVGGYPTRANGLIVQTSDLAGLQRTFAHELGHYLGLAHPFEDPLVNPQTGLARKSDYWDLMYLKRSLQTAPDGGQTENKVFRTQDEAAPYESQLTPLRIVDIYTNTNNCDWCTPNGGGNLCTGAHATDPEGTMQLRTDTGFKQPDGSPLIEVMYTGDPRMRGTSFVTATADPGGSTTRGWNVMDYGCNRAGTLSALTVSLSESQILQVRRTLRFDVTDQFGRSSRRPRLGLGSRRPLTEKLDFDGVGGRDIAVYEPVSGKFSVKPSGSNYAFSGNTITVALGGPGDIPVPADFDGDGKADYAVVTYSGVAGATGSATWRWCPSSVKVNQGTTDCLGHTQTQNPCTRIETITWGDRDMVFIPDVDFDGNSSTPEIALFAPKTSEWFWSTLPKPDRCAPATPPGGDYQVTATSVSSTTYPGGLTAEPLVGLYDSDNKTDIAVFDAPSHVFAMRLSSENYQTLRVVNMPAPPVPTGTAGTARPMAISGMRSGSPARLALAAWYPGDYVRIVWNPAALPASWTWDGGAGAVTTSCFGYGGDQASVAGAIDVNNDSVSDIVQYYRSWDGTYGIFYITPITAQHSCAASYNVGVPAGAGEMKLVPFIVGDMKGDGKNELGVINPDTSTWTFFPSDVVNYGGSSFSFQFGSNDAQPL